MEYFALFLIGMLAGILLAPQAAQLFDDMRRGRHARLVQDDGTPTCGRGYSKLMPVVSRAAMQCCLMEESGVPHDDASRVLLVTKEEKDIASKLGFEKLMGLRLVTPE